MTDNHQWMALKLIAWLSTEQIAFYPSKSINCAKFNSIFGFYFHFACKCWMKTMQTTHSKNKISHDLSFRCKTKWQQKKSPKKKIRREKSNEMKFHKIYLLRMDCSCFTFRIYIMWNFSMHKFNICSFFDTATEERKRPTIVSTTKMTSTLFIFSLLSSSSSSLVVVIVPFWKLFNAQTEDPLQCQTHALSNSINVKWLHICEYNSAMRVLNAH